MVSESYAGVSVAGAGQSVYEKRTDKSVHRVIWEAAQSALASAHLPWEKVDGLALTSYMLGPDDVTTVAEHFGLEPRWLYQGAYGGASAIIGILQAARAIQAGDASVVVCVAADVFDVATHNEMIDRSFSGPLRDYLAPFGFGGANGVFALHTRVYMEKHGTRREDFGRLAIAQRANALRNPNALFKQALTMDAYLNARPIADPLRLYDCVLPCCGGDAVVLCGAREAVALGVPVISIRAGGQRHNSPVEDIYGLRTGWHAFCDELYEQAGSGPQDMDFAQLYDDYPVMEFLQLEGLGFCREGAAAELIRAGRGTAGKPLLINTGGGQLSAGQAGAGGGMIGVVEAVLQLRGEAADRQISCRQGLASGYGMVSYGRGLSTAAMILGNEA